MSVPSRFVVSVLVSVACTSLITFVGDHDVLACITRVDISDFAMRLMYQPFLAVDISAYEG